MRIKFARQLRPGDEVTFKRLKSYRYDTEWLRPPLHVVDVRSQPHVVYVGIVDGDNRYRVLCHREIV